MSADGARGARAAAAQQHFFHDDAEDADYGAAPAKKHKAKGSGGSGGNKRPTPTPLPGTLPPVPSGQGSPTAGAKGGSRARPTNNQLL